MPFLRYYPEPPAVLIAQILAQAKQLVAPEAPAPPVPAEDPWGEDGEFVRLWFSRGERIASKLPARQARPSKGGTNA